MKKLLILALILTCGVCFAQAPDTVVVVPDPEWNPPFWLSALIGLIVALIPTALWAKGKYRLGKFSALAKIIADAVDDRNIDANEQKAIAKALKELVAKEES